MDLPPERPCLPESHELALVHEAAVTTGEHRDPKLEEERRLRLAAFAAYREARTRWQEANHRYEDACRTAGVNPIPWWMMTDVEPG